MSKFGERFNAWLVAKGREPLAPGEAELYDDAMDSTVAHLRAHHAGYVAAMQRLGHFLSGVARDKAQ